MRRQLVIAMAAAVVLSTFALSGPAGATNIGTQGCTPGYWKNHTANWQEYTPDTKLSELWNFPSELASFGDWTMLQALQAQGGTGVKGATEILVRAASAAYLNAAHEGVGYPYRRFSSPFNIQLKVNTALASLTRSKIISLATTLDTANNLGCPLN